MNITKIGMAWITVSDIQKSKEFFTKTLGLKIQADSAEYGWLEVTGTENTGMALGIGQFNPEYGSEVKPGHNAIVTFTVGDIVAAKAELQKHGVTILGDITEVPGHVKMLFFADADNNLFQLVQVLDNH